MQTGNENYSPTFIVRDMDGNYRWTYEMDSSENNSMLKTYMLIFGLIILIPGLALFFMIFGNKGYLSGAGTYLLIWMAIFFGVELLTVLIYKGIEKVKGGKTDYPYLMSDSFIMVHPGNEWTPEAYLRTDFSNVKDVKLDQKSDLILLNELLRVTHVYVPQADFKFVLNFILDRVPDGDRIRSSIL